MEKQSQHPHEETEEERLLAQLTAEAASEEERLRIAERFVGLVQNVLSWAKEKGLEVKDVKRLGGGFKNPVLMLTSADGKSYVAKAFVEAEAVATTRRAQELFEGISREDERFIPNSEFNENSVLFSEKAEGSPVKSLLEESIASGEVSADAAAAFFSLGSTLGTIHERTESPITDESHPETVDSTQIDAEKIARHCRELDVTSLVDITDEQLQAVLDRIGHLTKPEFVSLVHADAHLDQFFYSGSSLVEIVDYDDLREGDPMADLGRALSSLRDWCGEFDAPFEIEAELTRQVVRGYESTRTEDFSSDNDEMDYMRVVAYELRLRLVQLKQFKELRGKIGTIAQDLNLEESDIVLGTDEAVARVVDSNLSEEERMQLSRLRRIGKDFSEIVSYLTPVTAPAAA